MENSQQPSERLRQIEEVTRAHKDESDASFAEQLRVSRWWDTYNAALTSVISRSDIDEGRVSDVSALCTRYADIVHGPLEK